MHGRKPLPETPTIAYLMQKGTGSGGMHDTAFCGSWPHHASTSDSLLRGFGEFLGIVDPSASASDTAKTAVNWIRERKQPFFLTVSLTNTAAEEPLASTDTAMGIVMDAVKAACEESAGSGIKWDDTVFISVSLPSRLNAARIHESAAEADLLAPIVVYTPVSEKQAASGMASRSVKTTTSILDIAPSVLGFAGLSGLLESRRCADYFETLSAYAGFSNPLPLPGRDMSTLCLSGHSSRYLDESEFGFNDSFVENVFREGTASQGVSTICKVVSPLANLLTNTQRTVSMCMDESCNHLLAPAPTESDKTVYSAFTKTDGIMCRYFCDVGNHSPSGSKLEVLWYSVDDDLLNDTTRGAIEPINLRLRRMKIVARSERKQRLFDLSKDNGELQDIASHQAYACIFKIGKRLLNEVRSLAK